jgi:hypothetical protein
MRTIRNSALLTFSLLLFAGTNAVAQTTATDPILISEATSPATTPGESQQPATPLVDATLKLKTSSEELLRLQTEEVKKSTAQVELLRQLYSEGLIAKVELDESEAALAAATAKLTTTQNQINGSEKLIGDIKAAEELAKSPAKSEGRTLVKPTLWTRTPVGLSPTATILRSSGSGSWTLGNLSNVQQFFAVNFGRALPTSAVGQSLTHNRLGYDHRNAVDVALHPDSTEGRALISYLQANGIPFLAFRAAVPGVATGPHIHIGSPSHRLA